MKRLAIKVGEYEKDGKTKGKYVDLGVILTSENGEYCLLNPSVNLAGVLIQQRVLNAAKGQKGGKGDMVMCSIFSDDDRKESSAPAKPANEFDDDIPF
jgi:hypothetical protein